MKKNKIVAALLSAAMVVGLLKADPTEDQPAEQTPEL